MMTVRVGEMVMVCVWWCVGMVVRIVRSRRQHRNTHTHTHTLYRRKRTQVPHTLYGIDKPTPYNIDIIPYNIDTTP